MREIIYIYSLQVVECIFQSLWVIIRSLLNKNLVFWLCFNYRSTFKNKQTGGDLKNTVDTRISKLSENEHDMHNFLICIS